MTDDGHANDLAGLYLTWHRSSPEEWKALNAGGSERGLIYTQFVAQTAMCCGEGGIKAWIMCGWVFYHGLVCSTSG